MSTPADPDGAGVQRPLLRVVRGEPTADQLGALIAVVAARGGAVSSTGTRSSRRRLWNAPARMVRVPLAPGPQAWRSAALPG